MDYQKGESKQEKLLDYLRTSMGESEIEPLVTLESIQKAKAEALEAKKEADRKKRKNPKAVAGGKRGWMTRQNRLRKQMFFTDNRD